MSSAQSAGPDRFAPVSRIVERVLDPALDVLDALDRVVDACVRFTSATEAGIVLADRDGVLRVVASTSERSSDAEEAQLGTNQGSCLDCYRTGGTVDVPDVVTHEAVWPVFIRTMRERGLVGTFAEPVRLRAATIGSMCVFADHSGGHDDADVVLIQLLADAVSAVLIRQRTGGGPATLGEQVADVLEARVVLEQAKGALSYRRGIRIDDAFQVIRHGAARPGRGIRAVADDIVYRGADLHGIA